MPDAECPENDDLMAAIDGDPTSPEIARHLAGCERCRRRADELRSGVNRIRRWMSHAADLAPPQDAASPTEAQPLFIEHFFVGGVALRQPGLVIYRASHSVVRAEVLLCLFEQTVEPQSPLGELLVQQTKRIAAIRGRALPTVHDLGFFQQAPFLVTDAPSGQRMDRCAEGHARASTEAARLMSQLADAVAALHEQGIVHGLIGPQLALLAGDGQAEERAWLLGSGVAWLAQAMRAADGVGGSRAPSEAGEVALARGPDRRPYLAPELAPETTAVAGAGRTAGMSQAGDAYALGGLLHLLLTGSPPDAPPARLADCAAPPALARLTRLALSPDPAQRPTAAELAAQLRRFASPGRLSKWIPGLIAGLAVAALTRWFMVWGR